MEERVDFVVPKAVVRDVAKRLKQYMDVMRREEGFDLSDMRSFTGQFSSIALSDSSPRGMRVGGVASYYYQSLQDKHLDHYLKSPLVRRRVEKIGAVDGDFLRVLNEMESRRKRFAKTAPKSGHVGVDDRVLYHDHSKQIENTLLTESVAKILLESMTGIVKKSVEDHGSDSGINTLTTEPLIKEDTGISASANSKTSSRQNSTVGQGGSQKSVKPAAKSQQAWYQQDTLNPHEVEVIVDESISSNSSNSKRRLESLPKQKTFDNTRDAAIARHTSLPKKGIARSRSGKKRKPSRIGQKAVNKTTSYKGISHYSTIWNLQLCDSSNTRSLNTLMSTGRTLSSPASENQLRNSYSYTDRTKGTGTGFRKRRKCIKTSTTGLMSNASTQTGSDKKNDMLVFTRDIGKLSSPPLSQSGKSDRVTIQDFDNNDDTPTDSDI